AFSLKYVTEFINSLKFDVVTVLEPHSDVTPALLSKVAEHYVTPELLDIAKKEISFDEESDYIVFPDAGSAKRYGDKIYAKNVLIGNKVRNFETGEIISLDIIGDTFHNHINPKAIIVDDLSSYGGTF